VFFSVLNYGGSGGIRTHDQRIKSPLLYQLSYRTMNVRVSGATDRDRTCDLGIRSPTLYPTELRLQQFVWYSENTNFVNFKSDDHLRDYLGFTLGVCSLQEIEYLWVGDFGFCFGLVGVDKVVDYVFGLRKTIGC
jgi:hypothetical protein